MPPQETQRASVTSRRLFTELCGMSRRMWYMWALPGYSQQSFMSDSVTAWLPGEWELLWCFAFTQLSSHWSQQQIYPTDCRNLVNTDALCKILTQVRETLWLACLVLIFVSHLRTQAKIDVRHPKATMFYSPLQHVLTIQDSLSLGQILSSVNKEGINHNFQRLNFLWIVKGFT